MNGVGKLNEILSETAMKNHRPGFRVLLIIAALCFGCSKPIHETKSTQPATAAVANMPGSTEAVSPDTEAPHIDCPLRKQGINPNMLKPFEDTERYIQFLDRPDRALWQKPD